MVNRTRAIPRLGRARVQHLVRGAARRRRRRFRHGLPAGDRAGGHLRRADASRDGPGHGARGPGQVQPGREGRACRAHDGRPDVLLAEHQHLPRPALGPRAGDLRRGPLPLRPPRGRLHHRHAGRRPRPPGRDRHGQALRRALRPGAAAARLRREGLGARHRGHLPARLPRGGRRGQGEVGDVRVQRHQRRARLRQRVPARRHAARAVEVPGVRHRRLRRRARRRDRPQVREVRRRGRGLRDQGRPGQRLHDQRPVRPGRRPRLPALHRRGEAGAADRGGDRRGPEAHAAPALRAGPLRPARHRQGGAGPGRRARQPRAPRPRAEARPRVDGAAEERRRPAVREGAGAASPSSGRWPTTAACCWATTTAGRRARPPRSPGSRSSSRRRASSSSPAPPSFGPTCRCRRRR